MLPSAEAIFFICVGMLSVCRTIMPNHAVLRQHLLRHSTYTIHSKLCMIVHNTTTSSSELMRFIPSYCNFCLCCIHVHDMDRKLFFESLASWSPSIENAFPCIPVRLWQLLFPGSLFCFSLSFSWCSLSLPQASWLSAITLSKEPGPRFTSQTHYFLFSLPVFLRHFPYLRNEGRKRKSNSGSPFFRRLAKIRVGGSIASALRIFLPYLSIIHAKQGFEAVCTGALWVEKLHQSWQSDKSKHEGFPHRVRSLLLQNAITFILSCIAIV